MWWCFAFGASTSSIVAVPILASVIGVWLLLRPNAVRIGPPEKTELDRARLIAVRQSRADALLALMGDKNFLFSESGNSFLMFSKFGSTWAALGNPVGPESERAELVWRFIEFACSEGGQAAFYQVPPATLSLYLDAGLSPIKVGEEARIALPDFSLAGANRTKLRYALRRGERDGLEFEIISASRAPALIEHVDRISKAWLSKRINPTEKYFSVAALNRDYLSCQQLALVRRNGKPIAFASVMTTEIKQEATLGLMRYQPEDAPSCTMEYLLVQLLLHFKRDGYNTFSIGVAPLSGSNKHPLARSHGVPWLIASVARRYYNFDGIRAFKAKFDPAWEPRYLVASGAFGPYLALFNIGMSIVGRQRPATRPSRLPIERWRFALGFCSAAVFAVVAAAYVRSGIGETAGMHIFYPAGAMRGFVVLFSDARGWTAASNAVGATVSRTGAIVVGVDLEYYLKKLAQDSRRGCGLAVHDVEVISKRLQRKYGNTAYITPIIAGIGEGGTLAEAILAKAPPATIKAAVSLDLRPVARAGEPLCFDIWSRPNNEIRHAETRPRFGTWLVGFTADAEIKSRRQIEEMKGSGAPTKIVSVAEALSAPEAMALLVRSAFASDDPNTLDLPLVELPASPAGQLLAVFLSGDGGWRDLDRTIGIKLQSQGVSVIGWDALRYFWNRKSPEQTARDLDTVIKVYSARYKASKVALIGYSFGADVLPFAYNLLSPEAKARVVQLSLLSPGTAANFEIKVGGWFGLPTSKNALPAEPALASITPAMIQCFYGEDDSKSVCPSLTASEAEVVQTVGGHHFNGHYDALAREIRARFERLAGN
ncbi:MAG: phosphatidylglycerol lysyltransferase domain-containing protein [Methyloceanibacter sp.]